MEFESTFEFGPAFFEVLLKHSSTLEVLRLEGECYVDSEGVDRLLCSVPNLKDLYIANDHKDGHEGGYLDAKITLDSEWGCSNLEVFAYDIGSIPRPDVTRTIGSEPATEFIRAGTFKGSLDLLHQIYSKIAWFTKLRELILGFFYILNYYPKLHVNREYNRQYECLAMTLDSGLHLLKSLKGLW